MTTQDKTDFIQNKMEDLDNMGLPDECVAMVLAVVEELADEAEAVDLASKDLAVAREMLAAKDAEIAALASLAELRKADAEMAWRDCEDPKKNPCLACAACVDNVVKSEAAKDVEIAAMAKTLAERDALCAAQTRTINGIPALMKERDAEKARADAAEQLVCEMRGVLRYYATRDFDSRGYSDSQLQAPADAALANTEPAAGRWVPWADFERSGAKALVAMVERDAAIAAKEAAEELAQTAQDAIDALLSRIDPDEDYGDLDIVDEGDGHGKSLTEIVEMHIAKVVGATEGMLAEAITAKEAAERERDRAHSVYQGTANAIISFCYRRSTMLGTSEVEAAVKSLAIAMQDAESREHALGVQVDALQKRLALADKVVESVRHWRVGYWSLPAADGGDGAGGAEARLAMSDALAALDAVPGDALAVPPKSDAYTVEQIRDAFARACLDDSTPFFPQWPAISKAVCDALAAPVDYREASGVDVERVSVERDPYTDEGSNGFVERAGKGKVTP